MSQRIKTLLVKYGSCVVFVAAMLAWFLSRVDWEKDGMDMILRMVCDGLTVSGVLLLCVGGLIWASNEGALDGIGYALKTPAYMFVPFGSNRKHMRYGEYVEKRREKKVKGYGFLLISGGITTGLSLIVLAVYSFL